MNRRRKTQSTLAVLGLGVSFLAVLPTASAEPRQVAVPLFAEDTTARAAGQADKLRQERPANAAVRIKRANAAVVGAGTELISLDLGDRTVTAVRDNASTTGSGNTLWTGQVRETAVARSSGPAEVGTDEYNSVTLVRSGEGVTGTVRVSGVLYQIHPVAGGQHAVLKVDESKMPQDHPRVEGGVPTIAMPATQSAGAAANTVIRVQVVATQQAVNGYNGDMRALVDLAVSETNKGYLNSGVGITLELAHYSTVNYTEAGMSTDLSRFRGTSDGYMDGVHALRDQYAADVNVLILNASTSCGIASGIGSSAATAFAVVARSCATGYYSFGHEIGHLQSARHDPATDSKTTPYAYGHGYRYGSSWRTIMAYNCSPSCPRINYWSNPRKTYNGVAMGTTDRSDNARVLEQTKATIAAFRGGTATPTNELSKGTAVTGLSGASGSSTAYTLTVPAGATNLSFSTSGGTGDMDLYVKFGSAASTSSYDCRSTTSSSTERCAFTTAQAGTYHVTMSGYSAYSGVSLVADYTS
ncbi:pre-peptidase C-terminal domain-containing protein [Actinokineospora alba]|uniref:Pre-peptidase C-terminal domain-containing protein n=1 Tax=Actinokineospora alba TaxID=504798 RepID=A0A1H0M3H0_9PSEU|nr:M12 family metallo-peptidase [Actinokineospora alba]TDP67566.1 peptidyl-Asp metalloendopeptidase [Actinokineospora alba]SDI45377.1 pre-peptidase C-terminal domain-containing protein [Actinokineospora alba]SDO74756.1 pre-peptidase C-terminal domain-containing protein [Actinokineospora alba]